MKLEIGTGGGGLSSSSSSRTVVSRHNFYSTSSSSSVAEELNVKPRGASPVIKNGFSGSIFTRKTVKKAESSNCSSNNNDIASDYFKSTYGKESSKSDAKKKSETDTGGSAAEVHHRRKRSVSRTHKSPDRRDKSVDPFSSKDSPSRYSSFSYLNLLPSDGSFPHRTQPIGDSVSRRNSDFGVNSGPLPEFSNVTSKSNLMVRSNPIGLAEPSNKKDGYAVGRDGSLYRSSENLFISSTTRESSKERSSSVAPKDSSSAGSWKERRSSWSTSVGIGLGRGLIETGKPAKSIFMPFGSTKGVIRSYLQKHMNRVSGSKDYKQTASSSSREEEVDIQKGIQEIRTLTESHHQAATTTITTTQRKSRKSEFEEKKQQRVVTEQKEQGSSSGKVGMAFKELDVSLKAIPSKDTGIQTVTLPSNRRRTHSLTKTSNSILPEENVTISLPGSRVTSRNPSMERKPKGRDSSVEIFRGSYEIVVGASNKQSIPVEVKEISSEVILMKGDCQESHSSAVFHVKKEEKCQQESASTTKNELNEGVNSSFSSQTQSIQSEITSNSQSVEESKKFQTLVQNKTMTNESVVSTQETILSSSCTQQSSTVKESSTTSNCEGVGNALKGLDLALEALAKERNSEFTGSKLKRKHRSNKGDSVLSVTVSLPASRRGSRCPSSDRSGVLPRSRRNSMDLYSAEYNMKLTKDGKQSLEQTSVCHIKVDENNKDDLNLCGRCHSMNHFTAQCSEFGDLKCPRCLEWEHWEDTCPTALISTECSICDVCGGEGHLDRVHGASEFNQRRCIVDMLGWEGFREWFYEVDFRSWWQLNGFVGVPLYKIYKRTTEWRLEPKVEETVRGESSTRAKGGYLLTREDSIDELMKSVYAPRRKIEPLNTEDDSGRSTPDYLKKYPGSSEKGGDDASDSESFKPTRKRRTFSETLSMLDDDILAELNIK